MRARLPFLIGLFFVVLLFNLTGEPSAQAAQPVRAPVLVVSPISSTSLPFTSVSGLVFSWDPIDRVTVGNRNARLGPAGDLTSDEVPPEGHGAPFRMRFFLAGAILDKVGVNEIEVRASGIGGRTSAKATISVLRVPEDHSLPFLAAEK